MNKEIDKGLASVSDAWQIITENIGDGLIDLLLAARMQVFRIAWMLISGLIASALLAIAVVSFLYVELGYSLVLSLLVPAAGILVIGLLGSIILNMLRPISAELESEAEPSEPLVAEESASEEARQEFVSGVRNIRSGIIKAVSPLELARKYPLRAAGTASLFGLVLGSGLLRGKNSGNRKQKQSVTENLWAGKAGTEHKQTITNSFSSEIVTFLLGLALHNAKKVALRKGMEFLRGQGTTGNGSHQSKPGRPPVREDAFATSRKMQLEVERDFLQ